MASGGVAAYLLDEGNNSHSTLENPLQVNETSIRSFLPESKSAQGINDIEILFWDEAPMDSGF
jgi:hypothetical protein